MKIFLALLIFFITVNCIDINNSITNKISKKYFVKFDKFAGIKLDGKLNESAWKTANVINDFTLPWEKGKPASTIFRAVYDKNNFYFSFRCIDTTLVVLDSINEEEDIENEDRGEIYFAQDSTLTKPYYCAEIDAKGRVLDYAARFHRQFDFTWNWPEIKTSAKINRNGYTIEAAIPLSVLKKLGFQINSGSTTLLIGVYRADFQRLADDELVPHWQAWIDPHVDEPDYHVPATFGEFYLIK